MTEAPAVESSGDGYVVPSFGIGELFLKNGDGEVVRLSWKKDGRDRDDVDRRRALPAGEYRMICYRLVKADDDGVVWHTSATSAHGIAKLSIEEGVSETVEIDPTIRVGQRFRRNQVGMAIQGVHKAGLSIYKDGARIPIHYRLVGAGDEEIVAGKMNYG